MGEHVAGTPDRVLLVLSRSWRAPRAETAFVTRSVAGALSRHGPVAVMVPADDGAGRVADGLFDLQVVGGGGRWPETADPGTRPALVLVDAGDEGAVALARRSWPGVAVVTADGGARATGGPGAVDAVWAVGAAGDGPATAHGAEEIGLHVAVNPLAAGHPHNGIGFVDYLLVLTDREGTRREPPTEAVSWLAAAFPRQHLVAVEGGAATVWRCRALRGVIGVDTRTDLWRLMAHARVTVDLRPGELVARECVESLRLATPVVVPAGTAAARLAARTGGGRWYRDVSELLGCVASMGDPGRRDAHAAAGRAAADALYGDAASFVARVGHALTAVVAA